MSEEDVMLQDYEKARKLAIKSYNKAMSQGKPPYLPALNDILDDTQKLARVEIGYMEIPVEKIVGTVTNMRQNVFSCDFLPLADMDTEFAAKWSSLYESQEEEGIRDAISVLEYLGKFYVKEGNKRVSVSRYVGMPLIQAEVTRIMPAKENELYNEFLQFFRATRMYDFTFAKTGSYRRLAKMRGKSLEEPWDIDDVRRLKSDYARFKKVFQESGDYDVSCEDAFLMYLSVYGPSVAHGDELKKQVGEMDKAFASSGSIVATQPLTKKTTLLREMKKILPQKKIKVTFVHDGDPVEDPWVHDHHVASIYLKERFKDAINVVTLSSISNERLFAVLSDCADESDVIFTTSPLQMEGTLKASVHFPDTKFLNCSLNLSRGCLRTYHGRMYEVKFMTGVLAAMLSRNHKVGYLAPVPAYGTLADINAFAIGVSMVDPSAKVYLCWTQASQDNKALFKENDITLFSGVDLSLEAGVEGEYGLYEYTDGKTNHLASPVWKWEKYYEHTIKSILDGTWDPMMNDKVICDWWGMRSGMVDCVFSSSIPLGAKKTLHLLKQAIVKNSFEIFSGELHSQEGIVQQDGILSMEEIITMEWLNENIVGEIPNFWQLNEKGKRISDAVGIAKVRKQ